MLADASRLRWRTLAAGPFQMGNVHIQYEPDAARVSILDFDVVEAEWQARLYQAALQNKVLYNSSLFRHAAVSISQFDVNPAVTLHLADTDYREYVYTRDPSFPHPSARADPLGTLVLPLTTDGCLVLAKRSPNLDVNPGRYFGIGGFFDRKLDLDTAGQPDIGRCVVREATEELGLAIEPDRLTVLGVVYDLVHPHPEVAFVAPVGVRASSIDTLHSSHSELAELTFVELGDIGSFLDTSGHDFADSMLGAFRLLMRAMEDGCSLQSRPFER
jgi:8-oxo-dGTP pyrophosphatase MutT (NUDIX family)